MPRDRKANGGQGSHWIMDSRRLANYNRDGFTCCWCGARRNVFLDDGITLTLDHCKPHSNDGTNETTNLSTACRKCNSSRGNRSLAEFSRWVAGYINRDVTSKDILNHVRRCRARVLNIKWAREAISQRSSFSTALACAANQETV